ncbi:MAG TPA: peptide-methionine (S)-S-oxide reductase MsrA [Candidatus Paceibacterota bacterium]|nr:peptide-methionine (S)-S-oxide reductase MsrA [Candidatus Paceibacterota bacterium]
MNEVAVFGGGCFWCTEAVFKAIKGVTAVCPGYAGGTKKNPTYEEVSSGNTGHAEVVEVEYDPGLVDYDTLLTIFFASHDPTSLNRQDADVGTQYRSAIFYTTPEQKEKAERFINDLNASSETGRRIVTEVVPLDKFYEAEDYHKNYFANHPEAPYCQLVINPKLEKVQAKYADLLKGIKI